MSNNDDKRTDKRVDRRVGWGFVPLSFRMRGRRVGGGTLKGDRAEEREGRTSAERSRATEQCSINQQDSFPDWERDLDAGDGKEMRSSLA